jgi:hypothetical protein
MRVGQKIDAVLGCILLDALQLKKVEKKALAV